MREFGILLSTPLEVRGFAELSSASPLGSGITFSKKNVAKLLTGLTQSQSYYIKHVKGDESMVSQKCPHDIVERHVVRDQMHLCENSIDCIPMFTCFGGDKAEYVRCMRCKKTLDKLD